MLPFATVSGGMPVDKPGDGPVVINLKPAVREGTARTLWPQAAITRVAPGLLHGNLFEGYFDCGLLGCQARYLTANVLLDAEWLPATWRTCPGPRVSFLTIGEPSCGSRRKPIKSSPN